MIGHAVIRHGGSAVGHARRNGGAMPVVRHMRGVTLVELIVSIVIISIAVISVLGALSAVSMNSASAMVQAQGVSIASAYLNEVLQKSFVGNGIVDVNRNLYDEVRDYNGLVDNGARDQSGNLIAGLGQFQIAVSVVPGTLNPLPSSQVWRVDVTVTHPSMPNILLTGYRTQY